MKMNNGALDIKDEGSVRPTSTATPRPTCLNRWSADFPTCRRVGILSRSRTLQNIRHGVSRGSADLPLPSKTQAVRASRTTHTIAQTSSSRGPYYTTFTRIEADLFAGGSNQKGDSPIHSNRLPSAVQHMLSDPFHQCGAASHQPQRLEHHHSAVGQPSKSSMLASFDSRESSWSTRSRPPYGVSLSRNITERMARKSHAEQQQFQIK